MTTEDQILYSDLAFMFITLGMLGLKFLILWKLYDILSVLLRRMKLVWKL